MKRMRPHNSAGRCAAIDHPETCTRTPDWVFENIGIRTLSVEVALSFPKWRMNPPERISHEDSKVT